MHRICEFPATQEWQLKYRASRDGWEPENFHEKCDGIPNTLTIIKSTKGNIFGGFTEQAWNSYDEFVADPNAFIFSLINKEYKPFKAKCTDNGRRAIFSHRKYGPTFGSSGLEVWLFDRTTLVFDITVSKKPHTFFGNAYKHPDFKKDTVRANSILAGEEKYFKPLEIEVFTRKSSQNNSQALYVLFDVLFKVVLVLFIMQLVHFSGLFLTCLIQVLYVLFLVLFIVVLVLFIIFILSVY